MRTTLNLPDALVADAKARAADEDRTFTSIVEEGLRAVLYAPAASPGPYPPMPTFDSGGWHIDINDPEAIKELLYEEDLENFERVRRQAR